MAMIASPAQRAFSEAALTGTVRARKVTHRAGIALLQQSRWGTKVLLVQQANGRWSLPKGKRKPGESIRQTCLRECREETGLEARALHFVGWGVNSRKHVRFYLWKSDVRRPRLAGDSQAGLRPREILRRPWSASSKPNRCLSPGKPTCSQELPANQPEKIS